MILHLALGAYALSLLVAFGVSLGVGRPKTRPGRPIQPAPKWGLWISAIAIALHGISLAMTWKATGPLALVSLAIAGIGLFGELRTKAWGASLGSTAVAFFILLFLTLGPSAPGAGWIWGRDLSAAAALGFLAAAGSAGFALLIQGRARTESFLGIFAGFAAIGLALARAQAGESQLMYAVAAGLWATQGFFEAWLGRLAPRLSKVLFALAWAGTAALAIAWTMRTPLVLVTLGSVLSFGAWAGMLVFRRESVKAEIGSRAELDRWVFRALLAGVPLLVLSMGAGALREWRVSGSWWSWSAGESAILGIAIVFGIALSRRQPQGGDAAERSAWAALLASGVAAVFGLSLALGTVG